MSRGSICGVGIEGDAVRIERSWCIFKCWQGSCGKGKTENMDKYASSEVAEGEFGPLT